MTTQLRMCGPAIAFALLMATNLIAEKPSKVHRPRTVEDLERPARNLSLEEAIDLALKNGTLGNQDPQRRLKITSAYWDLYASYYALYAREQALRQAFGVWRTYKTRVDAGLGVTTDLAQSRGQYELFREQRLQVLKQVLESEKQLRRLVGIAEEDGTWLVPADEPTRKLSRPDWKAAHDEAMKSHPELAQARAGLNAEIRNFKGKPPVEEADRQRLRESYFKIRDTETKVELQLAFEYRRLLELGERMQRTCKQRDAYSKDLREHDVAFQAGKHDKLELLLEAQRCWSDSLAAEFKTVAEYNTALVSFECAKGTLKGNKTSKD